MVEIRVTLIFVTIFFFLHPFMFFGEILNLNSQQFLLRNKTSNILFIFLIT